MKETLSSPQAAQKTQSKQELLQHIATLEATVARLETKIEKQQAGDTQVRQGAILQFFRRFAIWLLVILCALSLTLSTGALWVKRNIVNTDVWVEKTSQLLEDPAIRTQISSSISQQIFTQVDVEGYISSVLPEQINGLSTPLTNSLQSAVTSNIDKGLQTEAFQDFWANANRSAHEGIMLSVENGGAVTPEIKANNLMYIDQSNLVLNLKPVFANVKERLVSNGLTFLNNLSGERIQGQVTLATLSNMPMVLASINFINQAAFILPILAVLFGIGAVALSVGKRRTLMAIGWLTAFMMVAIVQLVTFAQYPLMGALETTNTAAAGTAFGILTDDLVLICRTILIIALLLIVAAFLSGPSRPAAYLKSLLGKLMHTTGNQNSFIHWIGVNANYVLGGIGGLTVLLIVFPLSRAPAYFVSIVSIAVLLSLLVATIKQGSTQKSSDPSRLNAKPPRT